VTTNQTFAVSPSGSQVVTLGGTAASETVQYTVTNTVANTLHTIRLFDAENVSVNADGIATFVASGTVPSRIATQGSPNASITVVNGVGTAGGTLATATPVGGQITFSVRAVLALTM
jgi:hypothetical protein